MAAFWPLFVRWKCSLVCCPSLQIIQTNIKQDCTTQKTFFSCFLKNSWTGSGKWRHSRKCEPAPSWSEEAQRTAGSAFFRADTTRKLSVQRYDEHSDLSPEDDHVWILVWEPLDNRHNTIRLLRFPHKCLFLFISPIWEHGTWFVTRCRFCRHWILWDVWEEGVEIILNSSFLLIAKKTY